MRACPAFRAPRFMQLISCHCNLRSKLNRRIHAAARTESGGRQRTGIGIMSPGPPADQGLADKVRFSILIVVDGSHNSGAGKFRF